MFRKAIHFLLAISVAPSVVHGQAVCLPAPRLLTTVPMGGQAGTTVDVTISGENFEDVDELSFSHSGITAIPKTDASGVPIPNQYTVTIAPDCPLGIHEARVMTRLGVSSSRVFNVGRLPEVNQVKPNTTLEKAMSMPMDSICNGSMTAQSVDYYSFSAKAGQRIVVDCAARGIDSKLNPVLIVADEQGNDLLVERRGGAIDFRVPTDGTFIVKVHDLTFSGGPYHFYRLALQSIADNDVVSRLPSTRTVSSFSWPPVGLTSESVVDEIEPNNTGQDVQQISLPCDITGRFFPAADVDTFQFSASKGEVWWVEVASERFGLPTDPSIVVQQIKGKGDNQQTSDLVELTDIPSPVKVSSNGYSYDGPPYNAGSSDIIGKIEIKEDGIYRLQLSDLFGGTRNDPGNRYRLIIRKSQPDFAIVGWALHMNLRNGDRNALSKPIALRGGSTMAIEVVAVRRDGFSGPIELFMENLPEGVTAGGLTIPEGQSRGILLLSAAENAPRGLTSARFIGKATIEDRPVIREGSFASMAWPVPNAWSEIPAPRLLADVPVSVCGSELAPITIAAAEDKVYEATEGQSLTIPLAHHRRCDFSGANMSLKTFGHGFDKNPAFDVSLKSDSSEAVLDLAKLKTAPGEYMIAFYGSAVARYQYNPDAVTAATAVLETAKASAAAAAGEAAKLAEAAKTASEQLKADADKAAQDAAAKQKAADDAVAVAEKHLQAATKTAAPKDIVDIVVSTPITIRVNAAQKVAQK